MKTHTAASQVLAYLKDKIPAYPYNAKLDADFVDELLADFQKTDILDEIKAFRWYYNNDPVARLTNVRVGLRRWIANAARRQKPSRAEAA